MSMEQADLHSSQFAEENNQFQVIGVAPKSRSPMKFGKLFWLEIGKLAPL